MKPIASDLSLISSDPYDVIVVGSGYGGAIAASRMARAGRRVCILERGREFLTGDFPDTLSEAASELQLNLPHERIGSEIGLYDIRVQEQQNVVIGCGLGGTSLINANVSLPPTADVLDDPAWPQELRNDYDSLLKQGFERATEMLKPVPYPDDYPKLHKLEAHQKSAQHMGASFSRTPINVTFKTPVDGVNHVGVEQQACTNCGDCVSGCNYGAKNTTQMNYLPDAWNHGAEIYCQASVRYLEKIDQGWRLHYQQAGVGRDRFDAPTLFVDGKLVVLAAGTLGSNEILLRSREHGLSLSDRLGLGFTGNGDVLGFGYNCDQAIDGIGMGNRKPSSITPVGPCITSVIDLRDQQDRRQQMVIEEGSLPGAIGQILPAALATAAGLLGNDTDSGILDELKENARVWESALRGPYHGAVNHTQTYLIMSHDDGNGQLTLHDDRIKIDWPELGEQENFNIAHDRLTQSTSALGGTFVDNPMWSPLMRNSLVTVHPLGGCGMGNDASNGVVNHKGQVFTGDGDEIYEGLYVSDGSIIPTSLAVNPLFTISALTERCCALIAKDYGWEIDYRLPSAPTREHPSRTIGIRFTETMRGYFSCDASAGDELSSYRDAGALGKSNGEDMSFTLTINATDVNLMLQHAEHPASITGTLMCNALSPLPLTVSHGKFNLFERIPSPPDTRQMRYRMRLSGENGKEFYFDGFKLIKDDPNSLDMWADTTTLYVSVYRGSDDSGELVGKALLRIHTDDFMRQLTTLDVSNAPSWEERLKTTAKFGEFFAGELYQAYGGVFYKEHKSRSPRKKRPLRAPAPEIFPIKTADDVSLRLTRYQGGRKGPVMLVHGLGVASNIFSTDMIETNLVEYLVAHDYDVWLLDNRVSILLDAAKAQSNADQVAQFDYPSAIAKIRSETGADSIQAVVHCYGAVTFFMSMLAGLAGIRSVVCSQIATDMVLPTATAIKTGLHLPSFLDLLGVDSLSAKLPEDGGSLLTKLYDKALGVYALAEAQGKCNNESCHRITFMYAPLYRHDRLNDLLHNNLEELFAEANITTFEHLAAMCRAGKVVDVEGNDTYLPHLDRLNLPILFISGQDNECYLPKSTEITYGKLCQQFGEQNYDRAEIPGYAHIDCIFGEHADVDVFPKMLEHLEKTAL